MTAAQILDLRHARPFVPFRIVTPARSYDVRHPDLVLATVTVGVPEVGNPRMYSAVHIVSIRHIIHLEPEPQPTP